MTEFVKRISPCSEQISPCSGGLYIKNLMGRATSFPLSFEMKGGLLSRICANFDSLSAIDLNAENHEISVVKPRMILIFSLPVFLFFRMLKGPVFWVEMMTGTAVC